MACSFGDPQYFVEDDSYCEVDLPFQMKIYSSAASITWPSTNGFISIGEGSIAFEPQQLPTDQLPANTICPYWDDLYKSEGTEQGIFYQFNAANTSITYEYYIGHAGYPTADPVHFTVTYDSFMPGVFVYHYYGTGNGQTADGVLASVGTQGVDAAGAQQGAQFSFESAIITPGLIVTCDTNTNTCTSSF
ncbi:hypothetical protein K431DRAFT_301696 [Polychaeton citri CBS 116435]|uniref:Uncharacterized protein n=1 Tax=Polychaeton citri CBS 116435 TaxID=1314669 RepID=A0A9P4QD11_9PEZI|nr:hypothetical protein K431DRAFT_301696 [Polychaeton citri CBS 116435]